jgi:MFS-type transporter involved in bile tolerance (Atg22 family)
MLTLIFLIVWLYFGFKTVKQQSGLMLFLSMVNEQTPIRAKIIMTACALVWPVFKFMK